MIYEIFFILFSAILFLLTFLLIKPFTGWSFFTTWLTAMSLVTFLIYGIDKNLAKYFEGQEKKIRVPEFVLNLLAAAGGFLGGWAGMLVFQHKKHPTKDVGIWIILLLSTLIYGLLIYDKIIRPNIG
jgi:uncharacterized membrane protein YsdA (DUF1294 family)